MLGGHRVPRRPRLGADRRAALRGTRVERDDGRARRSRTPRARRGWPWPLRLVGCASASRFGYWVDKPLTLDEHEYLLLARNLAGGRGFVLPAAGRRAAAGRALRPRAALSRCSSRASSARRPARRRQPMSPLPRRRAASSQAVLGGALVWLDRPGWPGAPRAPRAAAGRGLRSPPSIRRSSGRRRTSGARRSISVLALACAAVASRRRTIAARRRGCCRSPRAVAGRRWPAGIADAAGDGLLPAARGAVAGSRGARRGLRRCSSLACAAGRRSRGPSGTRASTAASCWSPPRAASRSGPATTRWPSARATWPRTRTEAREHGARARGTRA